MRTVPTVVSTSPVTRMLVFMSKLLIEGVVLESLRGRQSTDGRVGGALRARKRVVGRIGRAAHACAERRRDQHVEGLHQKKAPEREPGAARALRRPHRERGA